MSFEQPGTGLQKTLKGTVKCNKCKINYALSAYIQKQEKTILSAKTNTLFS